MTFRLTYWMLAVFLMGLAGCDLASSSDAHSSSSPDSTIDETGPVFLNPNNDPALDCNVATLEGELPLYISVDTTTKEDNFTTDCAKGDTTGDKDAAFYFESPVSGYFSFELVDADFDATISLHKADCEAEEIRCNDDAEGWAAHSRLVVPVDAGESMIVLVDGYKPGEAGQVTFVVSMAEVLCEDGVDSDGDSFVDCADEDCRLAPICLGVDCPTREFSGSIPETLRGTLSGESMLGDASCSNGGNRGPDVSLRFVAPADGKYRFNTVGSQVDTILYIRQEHCTGRELGCDDDSGGSRTSALELELSAGQEVIVVVDSWKREGGDYVVNVGGVEQACDDGLDNDNDGLVDCADKDCISIECAFGGTWPQEWVALEDDMLVEVNLRRAAGAVCDTDDFPPAPAFEMNDFLRLSARLHSLDMALQDYFEHEGLDGRSPTERIFDAGFGGEYPTGENISAGYATAAESVEGLMNSPGHCRNIMNPEFRVIGLGFAFESGSYFGEYWTQNFGGSH